MVQGDSALAGVCIGTQVGEPFHIHPDPRRVHLQAFAGDLQHLRLGQFLPQIADQAGQIAARFHVRLIRPKKVKKLCSGNRGPGIHQVIQQRAGLPARQRKRLAAPGDPGRTQQMNFQLACNDCPLVEGHPLKLDPYYTHSGGDPWIKLPENEVDSEVNSGKIREKNSCYGKFTP